MRSTSMKRQLQAVSLQALVCLTLLTSSRAQDTTAREMLHATVDPGIPSYKPVKDLSGNLMSVGTNTMETVMKMWIDGFTKLYPKVMINVEAKGSSIAEQALTAGRSQLAPLSRELMPDELVRFKEKYGYEPLAIKVALGSYRIPTKTGTLTFF